MIDPKGNSEEAFAWEEPPAAEPESALQIASEDGQTPLKNALTAVPVDATANGSPPGFGRLVGEMIVRFYEDDGLDVQFPDLGQITVGRLERSIPFIYNRLHLARQMDFRQREGQPQQFNINESDTRGEND